MTDISLPRLRVPFAVVRWWRPLLLTVLALAGIAALAVYVFPTRTFLDQRSDIDAARFELDALHAERAALEARVDELDADAEIELIARSEYGLVRPGEEAYGVLPAPLPPIELPPIWPIGEVLAPAGE